MSDKWFDYYKLQYDRIYQHESQRLIFSNMVLVSSSAILVLGIKFSESIEIISSVYLSLLVVMLNYVANLNIDKSRLWIKFHQERAQKIIESYDTDLNKTKNIIYKPVSDNDPDRRAQLQKLLHWSLILFAVIYPIISWLEL